MRKLVLALSLLCLALCGCSGSAVQQASGLTDQDYSAILPYQTSDTRGKHVGLISDIDIRVALEQGLMDLSKAYFSPSDTAYMTHQFLDYDELDATDGSRGLLGTLRDGNPNGLNPSSDEQFDTGNGIAIGPILVVDLYEIDFYSGSNLKGIAIGLAVSDAAEQDGVRMEITKEKMEAYLQVTGVRLVSYLRERFNEITSSIPIVVGAYQLNTDESSTSKGGYIYLEYFDGDNTTYTEISEEYVVVPSTTFTADAPEMATQFTAFKQDVASILPDNTYTTGEAKIQNGQVVKMIINITAHGKTAGEIMAVIQAVKEKMDVFTDTECIYKVIVSNNTKVCAILERDAKKNTVEVMTTY